MPPNDTPPKTNGTSCDCTTFSAIRSAYCGSDSFLRWNPRRHYQLRKRRPLRLEQAMVSHQGRAAE